MNDKLPLDFTSTLIKFIATILGFTWRYKIVDNRSDLDRVKQGQILAVWHEYILPMAFYYRNKKISCIASGSKDGKRLASILQAWKFTTILGSSSQGGTTAVRGGIRELKKGNNLIITPDGPRGPRREAKNGVAQISIMAKTDIIPVRFYPKKYWRLKSWDLFVLPKPFTTITIEFLTPISPKEFSSEKNLINNYINLIEKNITPEK